MCAEDNENNEVTPVSGVDVVVENGNNTENTSAAWENYVSAITLDRGKDSNAATGGQRGLPHQGNEIGIQVGVRFGGQGGGRGQWKEGS